MMNQEHLKGLSLVHKRLVLAYSTSIMGGVREIKDVKPESLQHYVELEIAEREINILSGA